MKQSLGHAKNENVNDQALPFTSMSITFPTVLNISQQIPDLVHFFYLLLLKHVLSSIALFIFFSFLTLYMY